MTELDGWDGFYGILGSAAGALIGLQFVVMTLISGRQLNRGAEAGAAFGTPTVVHFCAALLLSALLRAPWASLHGAAVAWGVVGWIGVVYSIEVGRRMRKQNIYSPEFEDWMFHLVLPLIAYMLLAFSAFAILWHPREILFAVGSAVLLLLFIGIHNSWDAVTYHVFGDRPETQDKQESDDKPSQ